MKQGDRWRKVPDMDDFTPNTVAKFICTVQSWRNQNNFSLPILRAFIESSPDSLSEYNSLVQKYFDGKITLAEFKCDFESYMDKQVVLNPNLLPIGSIVEL